MKGPSQAQIFYHDQDDDTLYTVEYRVSLPGNYSIEIKYDNRHIPGSPFAAFLTEPDDKAARERTSKGRHHRNKKGGSRDTEMVTGERLVNGDGDWDHSTENQDNHSSRARKPSIGTLLQAYVTSPSGDIFETTLLRKPDKSFAVQFTHKEPGTYLINVVNPNTGNRIPGCPFRVKVENEGDKDPTVYGLGLEQCQVGDTGMFTVKGHQGFNLCDLSVAIEGNSLCNMRVFQNFYDSVDFLYIPSRRGRYWIHVLYNGKPISGGPFRLIVRHRKKNRETSSKDVGSVYLFVWMGCDLASSNLNTEVSSPSGNILPHSVLAHGNNSLEFRFFPKENGEHKVRVETDAGQGKIEIFSINVQNLASDKNSFPSINKNSVLETNANQSAEIVVDVPAGIPRLLSVEFAGPGAIEYDRIQGKQGKLLVHYRAKISGRYLVSLNYDGVPVRGSPYHLMIHDENANFALNGSETTEFCSCYGKGLQQAKAGEISNFIVDATKAGPGSLMIGFDDPEVLATEVVSKHMGNCVYDVQYKIEKTGVYELTVMWGGKHVPGSPFKVIVD